MGFGIDPTGWVGKTLADIKGELEADWKSQFGANVDLTAQSPDGQLIGILAERILELWQLGEAIYSSFDPDKATDAQLDAIAALTGTARQAATKSDVVLTATGTVGTVLAAGRIASVTGIGTRFVTLADATILDTVAWVALTVYAVGDRRKNGGNVYRCITPGAAAASGGPAGTGQDIVDGAAHWQYLGVGPGNIDVEAAAQETGPLPANATTITTIETPVAGWANVFNVLDATLGLAEDTNETLRLRREDELAASGNSIVDAVRAKVLRVANVISCTVFANDTDFTDPDGVPPHCLEVLVRGGADADIREALFKSVAGGIGTTGTVTGTVTDDEGNTHTVKFSRPTEVNIYVDVTASYDVRQYPGDGDLEIKEAIVAFGDLQATGKNVVASSVAAQAFKVPGVLDANPVKIGTAPAPGSSATINITSRQLAVFDTSRIAVTSTPGTP
jgi:uncharacterized phage protein gp47/JayE